MSKSKNLIATIEHPFTFDWVNDGELLATITYPCVVTMYDDKKKIKDK